MTRGEDTLIGEFELSGNILLHLPQSEVLYPLWLKPAIKAPSSAASRGGLFGSRLGSRGAGSKGSRAGSRAGSKGFKSGSKSGSRGGSRPGSKGSSRPGSRPGTAAELIPRGNLEVCMRMEVSGATQRHYLPS